MEEKKYCSLVFLDISQALVKLWHPGLMNKISEILPIAYYKLFNSYLTVRRFRTTIHDETYENYPIESGVPHGSVLANTISNLYSGYTDLLKYHSRNLRR